MQVGAFGFLAGPSVQADGNANTGILDQRLALQWIQDNIHLLGGSKDRVTILGESAGGASCMHHLTAYATLNGPALFSRAIIQSPASNPKAGARQQEDTALEFLKLLNVSSFEEARKLPESALIAANAKQIAASGYGNFAYGNAQDDAFAPDLPPRMLVQGTHFKEIEVMIGHNANEGLSLVDPAFQNSTGQETEDLFKKLVQLHFSDISSQTLDYVTQDLYPPIYDGSHGYTDAVQRVANYIGEAILTNTANSISRAYGKNSYAYEYAIGSGLHAADVPYTFFNGPSTSVEAPDKALDLQELLTSFAMHGVPTAKNVSSFPRYQTGVLRISDDGYSVVRDSTENERNHWWQKTLCKFQRPGFIIYARADYSLVY